MTGSIPGKLLAAVAGAAALGAAATALTLSHSGEAAGGHHLQPTSTAPSAAEAALSAEMRRLWLEHTQWTRLTIVSFAGGLPDLRPTLTRLLRNQTEIGSAIAPYYGKAAGRKLTALLREHILVAVDLLKAAKAGEPSAVRKQQARWSENGDRIAAFLSSANPRHWPQAAVRSMMRAHLALTLKEAVARLQGRWQADIRASDETAHAILHMADALTAGIVAQFPTRFRTSG
jgi:hypothetical protein